MNPRTLLLVVVAFVLAIGTALLARSWLATERTREIAQVSATPAPSRPAKSILIARNSVNRGQILKPDDMIWQPWPDTAINSNYIVSGGAQSPQSFAGWVVVNPISAGEPIMTSKIISPGDRGFLAAVLRPGMRAISVPVTITSGISGFIFPGDYVDLISTYTLPASSIPGASSTYQNKVAETVLRHVRVIGVDQQLQGKPGLPVPAHTATFEVTPKDAEIIAVASDIGPLSLSLDSLVSAKPETSPAQSAALEPATSSAPAGSFQKVAATVPESSADSPSAGSAPPVGGDTTYTMDSDVSPLLPSGSSGEQGTITILRGSAKSSESIAQSNTAGGGPGSGPRPTPDSASLRSQ